MAKNTNNDLAAEKSAKNRLAVLNAIAELEEKIAKKREEGVDYDAELNKQLEKSQKNLVKIDKFLNGNNQKIKDGIDLYKESADSISSMSSMMGGLKDELKKTTEFGIEFSKSIANTAGRNKGVFEDSNKLLAEMTSLTSDLAQLNREDAVEIASKSNEIDSLYRKLSDNISELERKGGRMTQNDQELLRVLKERFNVTRSLIVEASKFANISKEEKEIYEELGSDLESIEKTFKKLAITASIFFSSFKNAAGVALFYIGGLVDEFNELSKGIGGTITQMFQLKAQSFLVSKLLGDEAGVAVTSLAEKMGNANEVTLGMSISVGTMSNRLGVSGEEAAQLVNQFGNLQGLSADTAMNTMEAASQLASANGVAPSAVMKDIAQNTEAFALYAKDGGGNMAQAAIEARRLGVDLGTAAKISDNLLDYQTSVQSEMQASVLLGRNLNLNRARELAYAGDTAGAMKEALNAAGGIDEFGKMDVYQKRAVAEALGTSVAELQQMSANMERAATPAGKLEESFNATTAFVREMGQGIAGTAVKGIGGMLIGMKDFKTQVSDAKEGLDFIKDSAKGIGSLISGDKGAGLSSALASKNEKAITNLGKGGAISPPTPGSSETATKSASSVSKIDTKSLLRGAAALLVMAAALYVTAKALQEFNTVNPDSLLKAGAALVGLGLAMVGLNYALAPLATSGILELVAGSMLAFGGALALAGMGAKLFGEGFSLISISLPSIVEQLSTLSQVNFLPIFGMATALTALGGALALVATTGLAALPVLAGIGLAAGAVGMLIGGEETGGENDLLLEEIRGLRSDIQTQPIQLNLDGRLVYKDMLRQGKNKSN
jgi:hypothetical protein